MSLLKTVGAIAVVAGAIAGSVSAAAEPGHFSFYACTGPAGTPSSFTGIKENLPATAVHAAAAGLAFRLDDGSGVFVVQQFGGDSIAQGITGPKLPVSCQIDFPQPIGTTTFSGHLTPAS
jgi:hypothetical protein